MEKIRHELSDSNIGWNIKQVMDLIQQKKVLNMLRTHPQITS